MTDHEWVFNLETGIQTLDDIVWGSRAARVLHTANELQIFSKLADGPLTAAEIAERCFSKPDITENLLIVCTAMRLLARRGDRYENTEFSNTYLVAGRPFYQGDRIAHSSQVWEFWAQLPDLCRRDDAPPREDRGHRHFIMAMHNMVITGRGEKLAEAVDLTGRRKLIDIGSGPGTYSIFLCRKYPQLEATIFDLPQTVAIAREVIAEYGMEKRVHVREGDWNADSFGEGNDVALMSNILHGEDSKAGMKLAKAYDSIVSGGLLVVQDFLLNDEKTGPVEPALFRLMVGAYSRAEIFDEIEKAGFENVKIVLENREAAQTVIVAEKP